MTLATPHRGAPKALDVLANGVAVSGLHVIKKPVPVLRGWRSMYELLPRYAAVWELKCAAVPPSPRRQRQRALGNSLRIAATTSPNDSRIFPPPYLICCMPSRFEYNSIPSWATTSARPKPSRP